MVNTSRESRYKKNREWRKRVRYHARPHARMLNRVSDMLAKAPCKTEAQSREFMEYAWCLGSDYHLDHIIPVSRGGTNNLDNLQILHACINHFKNGMLESEMLEMFDRLGIPHSAYYDHRVLPSDILD